MNKDEMLRDNISWNETAGKMPRANRGYGSFIHRPWLIPTKRSEEEATVGRGGKFIIVVKHIRNIFKDEELKESSTCAIFAQVRNEGRRVVSREIMIYIYNDLWRIFHAILRRL